ncbi:MAG: exodeoxyribonuclease VII large subunit, partial [Deltaproteobacteria bacterium RBG_13_53_10]
MDVSFRYILTVTELTREIKDILESRFSEIWIEGEISNLRIPPSGHVYFTLKDDSSQIRAVLFRMQSRSLRFLPEDGLLVVCRGRVSLYERRGEYQLYVEEMEPKGIGALQLAFLQLKEKLEKEGLFDPARKRTIPMVPRQIGIVTSPTGAVIRDILHIVHRRFENVSILLYPARVQGEGAAQEIVDGLEYFNEFTEVDVIILARGGGSLEDLCAFNEESVARAIYRSKIPVISAVGHETDYTISDFVADLRAPTPSAAAEMVVRDKRETRQILRHMQDRLESEMRQILQGHQADLFHFRKVLTDPRRRMERDLQRVDDLVNRSQRLTSWGIARKIERFSNLRERLYLRSPLQSMRSLG